MKFLKKDTQNKTDFTDWITVDTHTHTHIYLTQLLQPALKKWAANYLLM